MLRQNRKEVWAQRFALRRHSIYLNDPKVPKKRQACNGKRSFSIPTAKRFFEPNQSSEIVLYWLHPASCARSIESLLLQGQSRHVDRAYCGELGVALAVSSYIGHSPLLLWKQPKNCDPRLRKLRLYLFKINSTTCRTRPSGF